VQKICKYYKCTDDLIFHSPLWGGKDERNMYIYAMIILLGKSQKETAEAVGMTRQNLCKNLRSILYDNEDLFKKVLKG
jgi:hypothetical protein